jgi:hypothetical protein
MRSPYQRLRELCGASQKSFGARHGFGKMTLVYVEAGLYPDVSDRLNEALARECISKGIDGRQVLLNEYGVASLNGAYHNWQKAERQRFGEIIRDFPPLSEWSAGVSPFHLFAKQTAGSIQGFCKKLKVPAASVLRYDSGTTLSMPKSIEDALREVNYPYLDELRAEQERWQAYRAELVA